MQSTPFKHACTCTFIDDPSILDGTFLVRLSAAAQERLEIVAEKDLHDLEPMKSVSIVDIKREVEEDDSGLKLIATQIMVQYSNEY